MVYGYVRVSSKDQKEDRQLDAMHEIGIPDDCIYTDKQSGKDFERPAYQFLISNLCEGDIIFIKSIDRLGRNYDEMIEQWRIITKEKNADIVVIDMPLLDTRKGKDLIGTFLSDMVLQILSFVAENERENIKKRQAEGIAAAKARGIKFGRPTAQLPDNFEETVKRWKNGEITVYQASQMCGMKQATWHSYAMKSRKERGASG